MKVSSLRSQRFFSRFAWAVLAYNIPVILWGAYVRVSFSGDGCGANWPSCNGQFIPHQMATPMAIEFIHRMMTTVDTVAVLLLVAGALTVFPKRHPVRRYAALSLLFLLIEALLGAGLVLFRYVAKDQSIGRVWYLSAHLTNTMLLLAALTVTAWLAYTGTDRLRVTGAGKPLWAALAVTIFVSVTGTITALGDTLFPAGSLASGMQQDFANTSSMLLRLRVLHPLIALAGAAYLIWLATTLLRRTARGTSLSKAAGLVISVTVLQLAVGSLNLALLAPLPMQLTHLLMADLVWIAVVILTLEVLRAQSVEAASVSLHEAKATVRTPAL